MDRNEISHDPHHHGIQSGVSKMIFKLMVCSAQIMHLYSIDTNTIFQMDRNEISQDLHHLGVLSGVPKAIFKHVVHLATILHQD
jgi:hypothetical protein